MAFSVCIVDDDPACRRSLERIIEDSGIGKVVGLAEGGAEGVPVVLATQPDIVLIDFMMPDQDGIETMMQLKTKGYDGKYVMISQIVSKEMVGQAYQSGIEFFIQKPINRLEVEAVLTRLRDQWSLYRSLEAIQKSIAGLQHPNKPDAATPLSIRDVAGQILMDLGISGEAGGKDLIAIAEHIMNQGQSHEIPLLKEVYQSRARAYKETEAEVAKETKAIEQRIRRTVFTALTNLASIGLTDYSNPKFEHYAPLFFNFQDVRLRMRELEGEPRTISGKVNAKKFIQIFIYEIGGKLNKMNK
ncbi:response regulator [Paenibacillus sp. 1P07SE]|uniref:response regulator n=1 Tax=Paenibacillus sp. 1P07SE TaxID=3132209 RepID=UPI0039A6CDF0